MAWLHHKRRSEMTNPRIFIVLFCIAALACAVRASKAHENGQPNWITQGKYSGPDGVHCCGPNDCERLSSDEVQQRPDGLWLTRFNELVPYSEATPSEDGQYWRCHRYTGERRCFFAPVGGF